jgi:hypothetical protein
LRSAGRLLLLLHLLLKKMVTGRHVRGSLLLLLHQLQVVVERLMLHLLLVKLLSLLLLMVFVLLHLLLVLELRLLVLELRLLLLLLLVLLLHCAIVPRHIRSHVQRLLPSFLGLLESAGGSGCRSCRSSSLFLRTLRSPKKFSLFVANLRRVVPHLLLSAWVSRRRSICRDRRRG